MKKKEGQMIKETSDNAELCFAALAGSGHKDLILKSIETHWGFVGNRMHNKDELKGFDVAMAAFYSWLNTGDKAHLKTAMMFETIVGLPNKGIKNLFRKLKAHDMKKGFDLGCETCENIFIRTGHRFVKGTTMRPFQFEKLL